MTRIRSVLEWVVIVVWLTVVFIQVELISQAYGLWPAMLFGLILAPIGGILSDAIASHSTEDR